MSNKHSQISMICALLIGRDTAESFPGKNIYPVLGRPLAAYPLVVAQSCPSIERVFVSTDSTALKAIAAALDAEIIDRPPELAVIGSSSFSAFRHGTDMICQRLSSEGKQLELLVLLFANAPTVTPNAIEQGIALLKANPQVDSAVTVSSYNMWRPSSASFIDESGALRAVIGNRIEREPSRNAMSGENDLWYPDMGASIVRPSCMTEKPDAYGQIPWAGTKSLAVRQWGGMPITEAWQIPAVEAWIQSHEVDRLFAIQRTKWEHYYDSEKTVISLLRLGSFDKVFDFGANAGGLGLALRERFGVLSYIALAVDGLAEQEIRVVNPDAGIIREELAKLRASEEGSYDLAIGLGVDDTPDLLEASIPAAYRQLVHCGHLVFSCRLTDGAAINDAATSYHPIATGRGASTNKPYIVYNSCQVLSVLKSLQPKRIHAYGYQGRPSSTAHTPIKSVCFAVFTLTRPAEGATPASAELDIQLPEHILKDMGHVNVRA